MYIVKFKQVKTINTFALKSIKLKSLLVFLFHFLFIVCFQNRIITEEGSKFANGSDNVMNERMELANKCGNVMKEGVVGKCR